MVKGIIQEVHGQAGALPLLQYTLDLLWEEEIKRGSLGDRTLKSQTYRDLGGVKGALQKRADEIYAALGQGSDPGTRSKTQEIARKIFLRLVDLAAIQDTIDAPWRPLRRRVPIAGFQGAEEEQVLAELIAQRLLVINRVEADLAHSGNSPAAPETAGEVARHPEDNVAASKPIVEVAHEALFTCWHRLKDWISDARKVLFVKNRLANDCRRWKLVLKSDAAGANDELWRGSRLQEALNLRAGNLFEIVVERLSEDENRFLDRSYELRDKAEWEKMEQKRKQRELEEMAYERATALRSGELAKKHLEELRMYMKREIEHAIKSDELAQKLREERMWRQLNF